MIRSVPGEILRNVWSCSLANDCFSQFTASIRRGSVILRLLVGYGKARPRSLTMTLPPATLQTKLVQVAGSSAWRTTGLLN